MLKGSIVALITPFEGENLSEDTYIKLINYNEYEATDYMKNYAEQIRKYVPMRYEVLGTDGFGRSDSRKELRYFFEVNADYITYATLSTLVDEGSLDAKILTKAAKKLNIDSGKSNPMHT